VSIIGGVKVGSNLSIDANGILSAPTPYTLPIASDTVIGGVKVGSNLSITGGILSTSTSTPYTLPTASESVIGGVKVGSNLSITGGVLSAPTPYTLPTASESVIGGVKVGSNLSITGGVLSAPTPYTLPTASTSVIGGVKVDGTTIAINDTGVISYTGGFPKWATSGNNIYNTNTLNVSIGTTNPQSRLHILEEYNSNCSLIIQNNFTGTPFIATFSGNSPSTHAAIGTNERYMVFTTTGINYTFTVPTGGINCDILLVGGGGGGGATAGGGGGGGDVIYKTNVTLPAGNCVVFVGNGGSGGSGRGGNGSTSSITSTNASFISLYAAGGGGGAKSIYYESPGTTPTEGSVINGNYSSGGGGGGAVGLSGYGGGTGGGTGNSVSGTGGYNNTTNRGGGGGGAVGNGSNASSSSGGNGGSGLSNTIIGTASTYGGGGGGGARQYGGTPGSGVDRGGNGGTFEVYPVAGTANSGGGGGGGGSGYQDNGAAGGSGIVIIRYRSEPPVVNSTIDLIRGTSGDANRDFKIGNYNGDFIVKSSINGSDSDYIKMLGTNGAIYNFNNSLYWTQTSDRRIKENIEGASYDKCYENVDKLELKRFNYIKEFKTGNKDTKQLGFIAQEIKDIFPTSVFTNSYNRDELNIPDMHSIDIGQINYTLYGAVKKLIEIKNDKDLRLKRLEDLLNIEQDTSYLQEIENMN